MANGPWVNVTVQEGKSFAGEVQMNPEMVLRSPARSDLRTPMGTQDFDSGEVHGRRSGARDAELERPWRHRLSRIRRVWLWPRCRACPGA